MDSEEQCDNNRKRPGINAHMATSDAIIQELLLKPNETKTVSELARVALEVKDVSRFQMAYSAVVTLGRYGIVRYDEENDTVILA